METRDGLAEILGGRGVFSVTVALTACESLPLAKATAGTVTPIKFDVVVKAKASPIVDMLGRSSTAIVRRLKSVCPRRNIGGTFQKICTELTLRCSICNSTCA